MDLKDFCIPAQFNNLNFPIKKGQGALYDVVKFFDGEANFSVEGFDLAIIGIEEGVGIGNSHDEILQTPSNLIRSYIYPLKSIDKVKIVDLGNLVGKTKVDNQFLLLEVLSFLTSKGITAIIIGGSDDCCLTQCEAIKEVVPNERLMLTIIDSFINGGITNLEELSENYLTAIVDLKSIDLTLLGVQNYYNSNAQDLFVENKFIDVIRLKDLRDQNLPIAEVPLRDSSVIVFDLLSFASSALPANKYPRPNGLSALDGCQLGWYSGISDKVKSFSICNLEQSYDVNMQSVALVGQIIWHFISGFSNKSYQISLKDVTSFQKFNVHLEKYGVYIIFFSSPDGFRWWMEVIDNEKPVVVSCNKSDYYEALQGEMPKKWWRYFMRNQFLVIC